MVMFTSHDWQTHVFVSPVIVSIDTLVLMACLCGMLKWTYYYYNPLPHFNAIFVSVLFFAFISYLGR